MNVIGVDIGGTNIRAGIVTENGNALNEIRVKTPPSASSILDQLVETITLLLANESASVDAVGVGASGMIYPETGEVIGAGDTIPGWLSTKLKDHLGEQLPVPVLVENDVNVAALGEGWLEGIDDFVFVSIGTGLGGAIVHHGQLVTGKYGGAGEFGHMILHPNGIPCGCGKKGCAEKYVSGTALGLHAREITGNWDSIQLMEQVTNKDGCAVRIMEKFAADLSIVFINIQTMFDPPAIILGGGFMDSFPSWKNYLYEALEQTGNKRMMNIRLSKNRDQIGVLGAARLALNEINMK